MLLSEEEETEEASASSSFPLLSFLILSSSAEEEESTPAESPLSDTEGGEKIELSLECVCSGVAEESLDVPDDDEKNEIEEEEEDDDDANIDEFTEGSPETNETPEE